MVEGLVPDPRRRGSVRVVVGGQTAWTVPAEVVDRLALVEGASLPSTAAAVLDAAADEEGAFRAALRMLERRSHSRTELARKLVRKGHREEAADGALDRLHALGLLDDAAFAEHYVASRAGRGTGPARLRRDLAALGVAPADAEAAIATVGQGGVADPWQKSLALATRRAASMQSLPRLTRIRRLTTFLARRGFAGEEARRAIDGLVGTADRG
jgi:regulatory protein